MKLADSHFREDGMGDLKSGFTLVELMIVVAIVAILIMLSYPSYVSFIRKSDRSDAQAELLNWANLQHLWRADHNSFNTGIDPADTEYYVYTITDLSATSFTLIATAQGGQAEDNEGGVDCDVLSVEETGMFRLPAECWR
jgi:type IV pilus assembly protein PilE